METLAQNAKDFGIDYFHERDKRQGIVHVVGPEQGFTLPGTTIVCGDSHTSTHGAFGALAHGIGTSEVEHVLATQTLIQKKAKNMKVEVTGKLARHSTAKDIILAIIGEIGTAGGTGSVIEFAGEAIRDLSMEGRMTVCNMTIEGGARAGMIAPDEKAYRIPEGHAQGPQGRGLGQGACAIGKPCTPMRARISTASSRSMPPTCRPSSPGARARRMWCRSLAPCRTRMTLPMKASASPRWRALEYMGLKPGQKMTDIPLDVVWIGSCTNGRIEDLRNVAKIVEGKQISRKPRLCHDRSGLWPREGTGGSRGPRQDLQGGRLRMA